MTESSAAIPRPPPRPPWWQRLLRWLFAPLYAAPPVQKPDRRHEAAVFLPIRLVGAAPGDQSTVNIEWVREAQEHRRSDDDVLDGEPAVVVFHGDAATSHEFLLWALTDVVRLSREDAVAVMISTRETGAGAVKVLQFRRAREVVTQVTDAAKQAGFPLVVTAHRLVELAPP